jgi:hypothetical protein
MKIIIVIILISFISCNTSVEHKNQGEVLNTVKTEKQLPDSIKKINRQELFSLLTDNMLTIHDFKKGLIEETIQFGEPFHNISTYKIPNNSQIGCYAIKYDRYAEFVQHPHANVSSKMLAQVYVYRPKSKASWGFADSTEQIYSFLIARKDIHANSIPRIGTKKNKLENLLGPPNINQDSIWTYFEVNNKGKFNFDFYFNSDTIILIEFKKLKK